MVLDIFKKKKSLKELQEEIDIMKADDVRLDLEIKHSKLKKRVTKKRRSQNIVLNIGRKALEAGKNIAANSGDMVPFNIENPPKKKSRRNKKKEDDGFPFL